EAKGERVEPLGDPSLVPAAGLNGVTGDTLHGVIGDTPTVSLATPYGVTGDTPVQFSFSSCSLVLIIRSFILVRFRACGWFWCDAVLLAPPGDKLTGDAAIAIMHAASSRRRGQRDR